MHRGDDASADPTEAAAELTELAGVAESDTQAAYAWSLDDGIEDDEPTRRWPFAVTAVAVGASLALASVAGVLAYRHLIDDPTPTVVVTAQPTTATTASSTPVAAPPPPPPPPVTVTTVVVESHVPPQAAPVSVDEQFLQNMRARGWYISNPALMVQRAHEVCATLNQGISSSSVVARMLALSGAVPPYQEHDISQAQTFVSTAMATYPNCP